MAINQKNIFVYDDFSAGRPILMGILYVNVIKGGEAYSFEYDRGWLKKKKTCVDFGSRTHAVSWQTVSVWKEYFWLICRCFSGSVG